MDYVKLPKLISYALGHAPWKFKLEMDNGGFVLISQQLSSINEMNKFEHDINIEDLTYIIINSDKTMFEIQNNKIRALCGHSLKFKIHKETLDPSE